MSRCPYRRNSSGVMGVSGSRATILAEEPTDRAMPAITLNAEPRTFPGRLTVADLLARLGKDPTKVAVEVNLSVVPRANHAARELADGDAVEVVTLVGGGSGEPADRPLKVGSFTFTSRLFTGTGKFATYDLMRDALAASGCEVTTVAVRRERLVDKDGRNLLDFLDLKRYTILPNTAGCFNAEDAIRHARLARELLTNLGNPGAKWVKLECLGGRRIIKKKTQTAKECTRPVFRNRTSREIRITASS